MRAPEMTPWAEARLVNRRNAWGEYRPLEEIGRVFTRADGTTGVLGEQTTRKGLLTPARINRHFRADCRADIVGAHSADADNRTKWGALDIDQHGDDPVRAEMNRLAALHWYAVLLHRGLHPLLTASNGKGGFHLRVLLAEPIDAARIYHFLRWLTSDHKKVGLNSPPESFPKQADVRKCSLGYGNWLRLPGRHPKRPYWSEAWDGLHWLAGHEAIDFLLSLEGDDPALVPKVPPPPPPSPPRRQQSTYLGRPDKLSHRIASYMKRLPHGTVGTGRDDTAYAFACWLVRDLALPDHVALPWLEAWDSGNSPCKGKERLTEILKNARLYGQKPMGSADSTNRGGAA
jgi:hypothetical protein